MNRKKRCTAIVLAAGSGSRMKSGTAKQFMLLAGKPLIWYALDVVERSRVIDDCILVTGAADLEYMRREIVERYGFAKVSDIVAGGAERYLSVGNALQAFAEKNQKENHEKRDGYVFIHDGARPFLTEKLLEDTYTAVEQYHACVAAVPSKDTIKLADAEGFVADTPSRSLVWSIQTPQVFDAGLILEAYKALEQNLPSLQERGVTVTDDASVVELFTDCRVKLVEASYTNIKITTPEDMKTAETFLRR